MIDDARAQLHFGRHIVIEKSTHIFPVHALRCRREADNLGIRILLQEMLDLKLPLRCSGPMKFVDDDEIEVRQEIGQSSVQAELDQRAGEMGFINLRCPLQKVSPLLIINI